MNMNAYGGGQSPERRERVADPAGMLEYFEDIGEEMQARYEHLTAFSERYVHRKLGRTELKDNFNLESGGRADQSFMLDPQLYRRPRGEVGGWMPRLWLPSGILEVVETEAYDVVSTSYLFGRGLARNAHQPDGVVLRKSVYKTAVGECQREISQENLYNNNAGEIDELKAVLEEIETQLAADPLKTPLAV